MIKKLKMLLRPYRWLHRKIKSREVTFEELQNGRLYYSQFGEDILVEGLFGREKTNGFYIDIGAFDPVIISNTYLFYRKGWKGINIEPNPQQFRSFPIKRRGDVNLNLAVSDQRKVVKFSCDGVYSGIKDDTYLFSDKNQSENLIEVETFPLREILDQYLPEGQAIDFLSLDCEGHDLKVLESNSWDLYRPKVIAVEQHGKTVDGPVFDLLVGNGYRFYCKVGLTMVFLEGGEFLHLLPRDS